MRMRLRGHMALFGVVVVAVWSAQAAAGARGCPITAQAVYAVDQTSGTVLCAKNASMRLHPASTVKLMTALAGCNLMLAFLAHKTVPLV